MQNLHIAVCKEAIARKIDLSTHQVELIKEMAERAIVASRAKG
jgi:hypothetical protein